ncbi:MAG: hypothetical protein ACJASQ_000573 [Crocinitomicaceae bacterium]|jgi:hypothetical protein
MDVEIENLKIKAVVKKEQEEMLDASGLNERELVMLIEKCVERMLKEMVKP